MTGRVLPFSGDPHGEVRDLLPWYVNGCLGEAERARIEAHLRVCAECSRDLTAERDLARKVAAIPMATEIGWSGMRSRIDAASRQGGPPTQSPRSSRPGRRQIGWFLAAQAAILAAAVSVTVRPVASPASYHALASPPATVEGNAVVIFRPDARERDMRQALTAAGARLVDGPTSANAFVLHVPDARREAVLTQLRDDAAVVLAEPIDAPALR